MMIKPTVLVIYGETQTRKILEIALQSNDYSIAQTGTAREGLSLAKTHPPDVILLDLDLPDMPGHIALQRFREWYTKPIVILSVPGNEEDIVKALDSGANDYLVKPFLVRTLLTRVGDALRVPMPATEPTMSFRDLDVNLVEQAVRKNNAVIQLTSIEYSLLALFAKHEGQIMTHQYILRQVWGTGYISQSQYLRFFIAELRKKIEDDPNRPTYIITESGVGYRFIGKRITDHVV